MEKTLPEMNDQIQTDQSISNPDQPVAGYSSVGKKITGWTSNLLATAVVIIIAITVGTQLISSFRWEEATAMEAMNSEYAKVWPTLESCALEFGETPFQLYRESAQCERPKIVSMLQEKCREALEQDAMPVGDITAKELKAIESLVNKSQASPIEQVEGRWRIFHIETTDDRLNLPLVVGVRDDIASPTDSKSDGKTIGSNSRLVVWGLAMPGDSGLVARTTATTGNADKKSPAIRQADQAVQNWTTFVARSAPESETDKLKRKLIPTKFRRTLAIANQNGTSMIGFKGQQPNHAIAFFDKMAADGAWNVTTPWQQTGETWSAQFKLPKESPLQGIQVQLHVNHNETVRGMLIVQSR